MAPKTKEAILALNARDLIEEIEKASDVELLDDIEFAEMQREEENKGSGRKTVFAALKERRAELAKPERRADDQDAAVEEAFAEGKLPEEDRRQPVAEPGPGNPMTLSELGRGLDAPIPGVATETRRPAPQARTGGTIRVRAKSKGFYGGSRIRAGALFTIESEKQLAPWMELVGDEPEAEVVATPAADDSASGSNGSDVI